MNRLDTLIKNGWVFDPAGGISNPEKKDVLVRDRQIAQVREGIPASPGVDGIEPTVIDAPNRLIIPGLINAHLHSHDHYDRGRFDNLPLELWILFIRPWIGAKPLTPREIYLRTIIGSMEMVHTGATFAIDDVNFTPFNTLENLDATMEAYRDVGMKARVSVSVFDKPAYLSLPYVQELLPQAIRAEMDRCPPPSAEDWTGFLREALQAWSRTEGLTGFLLAPSAPQRCTDRLLRKIRELSDEHGCIVQTHVLETKAQRVTGESIYGKSIVGHLMDLGFLGERTSLVHCVWVSEQDLDMISEAGTSVVHCPISNLKLGSGVAPIESMLRRGINVALGTDNTSCNDSQNVFEVMKLAALLPKVGHGDFSRWPQAVENFRMATDAGARILGMNGQVGTLLPGSRADLTILNLDTLSFLPLGKMERNLVYSENGRSVESVMITGRLC